MVDKLLNSLPSVSLENRGMDLIVSQIPFSANVLQFYTRDDDDDDNNKDKFDNLPKVTRLINGKAKI